jgi:hypothetical protein
MSSNNPPASNPMLKLSIGSAISNPISDFEFLELEGKKNLKLTIIFIIIDIFFTTLIILQMHNFLIDDFKGNIFSFIIHSLCVTVVLLLIILLYYLHNYFLALITRFGYAILGGLYFLVIFAIKIINITKKLLSDDDSEENIDLLSIIFLFVQLLTVIPRISAFFLIKKYVAKLKKIRDIQIGNEHESFVDKIAERIQKGYTRWSNPNSTIEDENEKNNEVKQYFDKKEDDVDVIALEVNGQKKEFEVNGNDNKDEKEFIFDKKDETLL